MNSKTLFSKTMGVALLKIVGGIAAIALGHVDTGVILISSAFGNVTTRDAVAKLETTVAQIVADKLTKK